MKVEEIFHMLGGDGEYSYEYNSRIQKSIILRTMPLVEEAISKICNTIHPSRVVVADLGCASGSNTFLLISQINIAIEKYYYHYKENQPEIQYFLNDLPSNDFNNLFKLWMFYEKQLRDKQGTEYVPIYVAGLPGSFYGRLFPSKSVHFFHSFNSIMWLSQVPQGLADENDAELNKGNIYITESSSSILKNLYLNQFKRDFSAFLTSRSKELISNGKMILSFFGRKNSSGVGDCYHFWRLLSCTLESMISEGLVEEDKLNSFNLPFYAPLLEEVESTIEMEGSFHIDLAQTFERSLDSFYDSTDTFVADNTLIGQQVAKLLRALIEPLLTHHFGDDIMDELFSRFEKNIAKDNFVEKAKVVTVILVLKLKE